MCETLRKIRSRGRSGVPAIRFRCLSAIRVRRSFVVLIFISNPGRAEALRYDCPNYFAPVLPAFFFSTSPV